MSTTTSTISNLYKLNKDILVKLISKIQEETEKKWKDLIIKNSDNECVKCYFTNCNVTSYNIINGEKIDWVLDNNLSECFDCGVFYCSSHRLGNCGTSIKHNEF
jgi:hypothetical protein